MDSLENLVQHLEEIAQLTAWATLAVVGADSVVRVIAVNPSWRVDHTSLVGLAHLPENLSRGTRGSLATDPLVTCSYRSPTGDLAHARANARLVALQPDDPRLPERGGLLRLDCSYLRIERERGSIEPRILIWSRTAHRSEAFQGDTSSREPVSSTGAV